MSVGEQFGFGAYLVREPKDETSRAADQYAYYADSENKCVGSAVLGHNPGTTTIWITNLSYQNLRNAGLSNSPNFRHDKYLPVDYAGILSEWDINSIDVEFSGVPYLIAQAFARVMRHAYLVARKIKPKITMAEFFQHQTLREDFANLLPKGDYPRDEAASVLRGQVAYDEFSVVENAYRKGTKALRLRVPRTVYSENILETPVPDGPLLAVPSIEIPEGLNGRAVAESKVPVMASVSASDADPGLAKLFAFGRAPRKNENRIRSWVAQPELYLMSGFMDVTVSNMYKGGRYVRAGDRLPPALIEYLKDTDLAFSWSAGVVAEALWRGLCGGDRSGSFDSRANTDRAQTSWQGVFLRSADKVNGFLVANQLANLGYEVSSYGYGWVRIVIPDDERSKADAICDGLSIGLIPSLDDISPDYMNSYRAAAEAMDPVTQKYVRLLVARKVELMWQIDRLPLLPPRDRVPFMKNLVREQKAS